MPPAIVAGPDIANAAKGAERYSPDEAHGIREWSQTYELAYETRGAPAGLRRGAGAWPHRTRRTPGAHAGSAVKLLLSFGQRAATLLR
jgi:hypothetical protein